MLSVQRLRRELAQLQKESPAFIRAKPLENDILHFHYVIEGPPDSPYAGGWYHGVLVFPHEYPLKPPAVKMYTPSGRFQTNTRLCLSMSDFHPESWNPVWSVDKILVGLLSFMVGRDATVGSIESTDDEKRRYALESLKYNCTNKDFRKLFPELVELYEQQEAKRLAAQATRKASAAAAAAAAVAGSSGAVDGAGAGTALAGGGDATDNKEGMAKNLLLLVCLLVALGLLAWLQKGNKQQYIDL